MFRHVQRICSELPSLRSYSTRSNRRTPRGALVARTASAPLAVRERREKRLGPIGPGETDATEDGLTPTDMARYQRHRDLGTLPTMVTRRGGDGKEKVVYVSPTEWVKRRNARRSRIRGFRTVKRPVPGIVQTKDKRVKTREELEVVGQPIYLPNIIFRLVRNHTPAGQDYNPYEATFRVPPSITKTDIRSYLSAVYGVQTTYIRTDLYYGSRPKGLRKKRTSTYKRAVVGLVDPFYYPHRLEDMPEDERRRRTAFIEEQFSITAMQNVRKSTRKAQIMQVLRGRPSNSSNLTGATGRGKILAEVAKRRQVKEGIIAGTVRDWQQTRKEGKTVSVAPPASRKGKGKQASGET
ncbi:hypothetical protein BDP27DRAFT_1310420 [Rhodocollybia butyracea]|uniref:Large ribosomal subunit protein uL23m n=1 Tax=Rhodocollybia butyracea TaxID=206335 RepID=A0A9P5QBE6_9AGAR|nr:hypothetical protein BDP27DRAFT_1310420 [Rhodocollybia butyracea]